MLANVWVVDLSVKLALDWLERVVAREIDIKEELPRLIGSVAWAVDDGMPQHDVVFVLH